ncbi:MAG TPA: LAGLIDADG family homing endonuclease [Gemmatimonadales bacterium]|nr:LAGLIDADG family homing endonuclease [Gemmatimonadales bacterium]
MIGWILDRLGRRWWAYREGAEREFWILETGRDIVPSTLDLSSDEPRATYARGYFDAEGGIPQSQEARFYVQFVQKNRGDLVEVRSAIERLGLSCGRVHNPSASVDPNMWRFYVAAKSHHDFAARVGSWHPRKRSLLEVRFGLERPG